MSKSAKVVLGFAALMCRTFVGVRPVVPCRLAEPSPGRDDRA